MKHVGSTYLRNTLEDVLKLVILFKKPFELDPTRFSQDKPEKQEGKKRREASEVMDNAETNAVNLTEMNAVVTERIFKSAAHIPWQLKQLFHMIQKAVIEKFPDHENVRYTSVSGFLFLRFFAPAILGPTLFGLKVGIQDPVSSRKLLLIAKTLQNLSNLVEFGQKEPFMEPMNAFIKEKIGEMKKFIDKVSNCTEAELAQKCSPLELPREVLCKDFADLHNILIGAIDKMKQFDPESETLQQLDQQVKSIESKLRFIQEKENDAKYDLLHDTGVEAEESELNEVIKDSEEERKIMRMLTRAGSVDSIASDGTGRSSIGNYRNSVDLKESMAKGQVISQPPPPMTFIAVEPTNDVSEAIQVGYFHFT
jgi:hypothetical protein